MIQAEIDSLEDTEPAKREIHVGGWMTYTTLLRRDYLNVWRNPLIFKSRFFQFIALGIYFGGVFFDAGDRDYTTYLGWIAITGFIF